MKLFKGDLVPIRSWCDDPEEEALRQARDLSALPFVFRQVCLMPDAHSGYGMPIGGVAALKDTVIPNAVGVDIGCGMSAAKTSLREIHPEQLRPLLAAIRRRVPLGFAHHKKPQPWSGFDKAPESALIHQELNSARCQLGTLGGGNHFIEVQQGSDGGVWVMVHSGSRNLGYKIAKHFNQKAQALNRRFFPEMPQYQGEGGLAFLPAGSAEFSAYIEAMTFALEFALENRRRMITLIQEAFDETGLACDLHTFLNIHHNYAAEETHFNEKVWVHRKGATSARAGATGIIPGSQGTVSYIVKGKGHPESFYSCAHGAGRKMSRTKARSTLDLKAEQMRLEQQGILHSLRGGRDLDEAPSAYKDIDAVMEQQKDLVEPLIQLRPLAVIKG